MNGWLGSHESDTYYRGTPYPQKDNGVYILGRSGDCDNRNPNGDCGSVYGSDDYPGTARMNCTGFVWHVLWKASGLSYTEGMNRIPAWAGTGAGDWQKFIQDNGIEHMTLRVDGDRINDLIAAALSVKGPDGTPYLKRGDIIWFWASPLVINPSDGLPARGQMVLQSVWDDCHVGIYWPSETDRNRWWDSCFLT